MTETPDPFPYEVGYAKPPVANRFKKGVSGNPSGKARKIPSAEASIAKALRRKVAVTMEGKRRKVPITEALVMQLTQRALAGDAKCAREVMRLAVEHGVGDAVARALPKHASDPTRDWVEYFVDADELIRGLIQIGVCHFEGDRLKIDPEVLYRALGRDFEKNPHKDIKQMMASRYAGTT